MLQKAKSADNKKRKLFNSINVPDDDAPALPLRVALPRIGVGLFDANRVEGKVATNFDVGDIIHACGVYWGWPYEGVKIHRTSR